MDLPKFGRRITPVFLAAVGAGLLILSAAPRGPRAYQDQEAKLHYIGFDRNDYPGDEAMRTLRKDFAFTGYWLSPPPQEKTTKWRAKREFLRSLGYGFLVLYRGRLQREMRSEKIAKELGVADARAAAQDAKQEGFPRDAIIFLDIEEGGRLSLRYHIYLRTWLETLAPLEYRSGFYCSGIPVKESAQTTITTAEDIAEDVHLKSKKIAIWVFNDVCPPSPGCTVSAPAPSPRTSGFSSASVWQYAQSPRVKERTEHCASGYHSDGNCYAPSDAAHIWFLDLNSASSPDPSSGR
ncbi:MAG TPA: glycoside hydrolase domain-containing protein [Candidatus Acidoferrum sp.]|nr:glycoside hydrolase domain-containing protein [Candidatus Acidoferrum sp.]